MTVIVWIWNNSFIASLWDLFSLSSSFSKLPTESLIVSNFLVYRINSIPKSVLNESLNKIMKNRIKSVHRGHNFVMLLIAKEHVRFTLGMNLMLNYIFSWQYNDLLAFFIWFELNSVLYLRRVLKLYSIKFHYEDFDIFSITN